MHVSFAANRQDTTIVVLYLQNCATTSSQLRKLSLQVVPVFEKLGFVLLVEGIPVCGSLGVQLT